jgi:NADPH:quinone reductase-like Zn-dependent oxidoreductase
VAFVRSLGADTVIDYTQTRVEDEIHQVDLVLDTVGGEGTASALTTLKPGGTLLTTAGQPDERQAQTLGVRTAFFNAQLGDTAQLLTTVSHLIDEGQLRTSIAATFELREASKAQELSQRGHGRGRIILHIA